MKTTLTILFLSMIQIAECQQTIYDLWKEADEIVETFHFDLDKNIDGNYIVNVRHYKESGVYFTKNYSNVYKTIGELLSYCGFNYNHQNDTLLFSFHYNEFEVWRVSVYSKNQEVKYYFSCDENKLTEIPKEEFSEVDLYVENIEKTIYADDIDKLKELILNWGPAITETNTSCAYRIVIKDGQIQFPSKFLTYNIY